MADIAVRDNVPEHRYEISVDGVVAGFAVYYLHGTTATFVHTEVSPEFEGRGLASTLAHDTLDDVRTRGLMLVPQCPFIAGYIERHPEYQDLVSTSQAHG